MAVVTRKSTLIGNRDSSPPVANDAAYDSGAIKESEGYVTTVAGDSQNSLYPMVTVPSNVRVSELKLQCAAQGTGAEVNIGVFAPTNPAPSLVQAGYTASEAIDATLFVSALSVADAVAEESVTNQSGNNTIADQELELWEAAGLSEDPCCMLDIAVQVQVAIATAGLLGIKVRYAQ